jgi:hypothetical protein
MSWFARIEEACAAFIERTFATMFPSDVEPAQIARKLVSTMEARTQPADAGAMSAPRSYAVYVHPSDYERLREHRAYLEHEWAALLEDVARRVGIAFQAAPAVELREDASSVPGAIDVRVLEEPDAGSSPYIVLRMIKGMPANARYEISRPMRVGRNPECDIFLVDPSVSRNHAVLDPHGQVLTVRDAGSTNGTFVNGDRVQLRIVRPGDRIAFGKTEMAVEGEALQ